MLWIDPYPTRLPQLADFRRVTVEGERSTNVTNKKIVPAWLTILRPRSLPMEPLPGASMINRLIWKEVFQVIDRFVERGECLFGIGKPSALALHVLNRHPSVRSLYDAMDDFPAFYFGLSRAAMARRERAIAARVSQISVSSSALAQRFSIYHQKLTRALNACSVEDLPPVNVSISNLRRPVLGYVGTIGHWFDWSVVFNLAKDNPSMCIRLVGPLYVGPPGPLPWNIELLPACDHATAMRHMQEFSVGLIPFKEIELTASVDPIKYYEYRALGLPVLSSRFGEMALREGNEGVFLLDKHSHLGDLAKSAVAYESKVSDVNEFRNENSWGARFEASGILP